jgi:predicted Fe-Mo cluster-binding NifX family protein
MIYFNKDGGMIMKIRTAAFVFLSLFIFGGLFTINGQESQRKKIAVASEGETIDSQVSSQGARCFWLLFFDEEGKLAEALENPYRQTRGGAGTECAGLLADHNATHFIAGHVGDKMAAALESRNIAFISFSGTVKDAVAHVLEKISGPKLQP